MAAHREVAMDPEAGKRAPVAFDIARIAFPQALGQTDRRMPQHQFADRPGGYALSRHVDNIGADAERRPGERARVHRVIWRAGEDAASDLGSAGNIDDRDLLLADVLEKPEPGRRGPGLAAGRGDPQAREIVVLDLQSIAHQAADDRRRHAEVGHPVIRDQAPKASGVRIIRRAFGDQETAAGKTRNTGAHRAHHPPHIAEKEEAVRRFEVPADDDVTGDHRADETDVGPDAPLRFARGARRIEQDSRVFRLHLRGRDGAVLAGNDVAPPVVASLAHRCLDVKTVARDDNHVLDGRRGLKRYVEHGLERCRHAAPPRPARRDHGPGFAVVEAGLDRAGAESGEQRQDDCADLQRCEESDESLGQVRHVDSNHVATTYAETAQSLCEPPDLAVELPVSQRALLALVFAFPEQKRLVPHRGSPVLVDAVQDDVGGAAHAPARPGLTAGQIEHRVVATIKSDIAEFENFLHQPCGIGVRLRGKIVVLGLAGRAQESRQIALRHQIRRRRPRILRRIIHEAICTELERPNFEKANAWRRFGSMAGATIFQF